MPFSPFTIVRSKNRYRYLCLLLTPSRQISPDGADIEGPWGRGCGLELPFLAMKAVVYQRFLPGNIQRLEQSYNEDLHPCAVRCSQRIRFCIWFRGVSLSRLAVASRHVTLACKFSALKDKENDRENSSCPESMSSPFVIAHTYHANQDHADSQCQ